MSKNYYQALLFILNVSFMQANLELLQLRITIVIVSFICNPYTRMSKRLDPTEMSCIVMKECR